MIELRGSQTPRIESVPPWVTSSGEEAIELAQLVGMPMDGAQQRVLTGALGQRVSGSWSASEVGLVEPRQNGKSAIGQVATLSAAFLWGSKVVYTAHLMATSKKIREKMSQLIEASPDLDSEVKQIRVSADDQSIELRNKGRIDFVARTTVGGRGWFEYDMVVFDEAFALLTSHVGALLPIMFARKNWQLWYLSSAGQRTSDALRTIRARGVAGDPGLAYYEWSVPEEIYRSAPEYVSNMPAAWAQANPALGDRIQLETIRLAQRAMDPVEFAREVMGVWDDEQGIPIIDPIEWALLADHDSGIVSGMVFALDCDEGLSHGCIGVAGYRSDDIPHVEITSREGVLDHREGVTWMVSRAKELHDQWTPVAWIVDPSGPAGALLEDLRAAGIEPELVTVRELGQACGALLKASQAMNEVRHRGQDCVTESIRVAQKRDIGDGGWSFSRRRSEESISPINVVALSLHGLAVYGAQAYDVLESLF